MPAPTVPSRTYVAMTEAVNKMKGPYTFIQDLVFSSHKSEDTETIEVSSFARGRKMAAMVRSGGAAVEIVGHTQEFNVVRAPNIRIKKTLSPWDATFQRYPGFGVNESADRIRAANELRDARDLQGLNDDVTNRIEWMCAQALRGSVAYSVEDGEVFTITYPRSGDNSITLSTFWDDGTITAPKPEEDMESAQRIIHAAEGLNITHALCGSTAATYLRRVLRAANWHLDTKDVYQGGGEKVIYGGAFNKDGARPIARVNGVDFWEYSSALTDEGGVSQPMIRPKYVEFVCASPAADNVLHFGAIPEKVPGSLFVGEKFSKSYETEEPPTTTALVHSRPLPVLHRPDATVSMKVISG